MSKEKLCCNCHKAVALPGGRCLECLRLYRHEYYLTHKEQHRKYSREHQRKKWVTMTDEERKERHKARNERRKQRIKEDPVYAEKIRSAARISYWNHREQMAAYRKTYQERVKKRMEADPEYAEKVREARRQYYQKHKEERRAYSRNYYKEHLESCRDYQREYRPGYDRKKYREQHPESNFSKPELWRQREMLLETLKTLSTVQLPEESAKLVKETLESVEVRVG